jgi:hypothetical protein
MTLAEGVRRDAADVAAPPRRATRTEEGHMRSTRLFIGGLALLLLGTACSRGYDVKTVASPDRTLAGLRTFRVLPVPRPRDGRERAGAYDPMVNNSITNKALREAVTRTLVERGYVLDESAPDFAVAVYASAREELDLTLWDYGYPHWPQRRPWPGSATTDTRGTVVVDIVSPDRRDLWWRGSASTSLSEDPAADARELAKVASAVAGKFPRASWGAVAAR